MDGFDPFSRGALDDPAVDYAWLQAQAPVHFTPDHEPPFYTLSRHADVSAALTDIETFSSEWGQGARYTPPVALMSDPPEHAWFRALMHSAFTPAALKALAPEIAQVVGTLLGRLDDREAFDLHDDFAFPLPVIIIARVMGVPDSDLETFKAWSDASVEAMGAEDPTPWEPKLTALRDYLLARLNERRRSPGPPGDLMTRMVSAERDGAPLTDAELLSMTVQLLVGGNETTTSLIANMAWRLLEEPSLWDRIVADPSLIDAAIEESLRYDPPVLGLYRTTTRDVRLHGVDIPKGAKVWIHYAAANRDGSVFPDPDRFRLDRGRNRHLAFGFGIHSCLGRELARLEARLAFAALAERRPDLALVDAGERIKPFFLWGRRRLPVRAAPVG